MINQTNTSLAVRQPYSITAAGDLSLDFHPGQFRAWDSKARIIVVLAGTQGGKTSFGPWWLYREIEMCGPGDYLVVTPTYTLLKLKALPEFLQIFSTLFGLGRYGRGDRVFTFDAVGEHRVWGEEQETPTRVIFGHAQDPESLESATAKAAWCDEAGQQKFKLGSDEAIDRRLSLHRGRKLITTTPYNLGWVKLKYYDKRHLPEIDVIRFDSTMNPAFPEEEMIRAEQTLPRWKFDMFYRAIFTRPPGMIYDCFDDVLNKCPRFTIPGNWPLFMGLDFGGVNTAAVKVVKNPAAEQYYVISEYLEGGLTAAEHAKALIPSGVIPHTVGGSKSEGQWRMEFARGGLPVDEPNVIDVEVGIDRVYGAFKSRKLIIFDDLLDLLDEIGTYSRPLDDMGEPAEGIQDKERYHLLDALRYIGTRLFDEPARSGVQKYA